MCVGVGVGWGLGGWGGGGVGTSTIGYKWDWIEWDWYTSDTCEDHDSYQYKNHRCFCITMTLWKHRVAQRLRGTLNQWETAF